MPSIMVFLSFVMLNNLHFIGRYDKTVDYWSFGLIAFELMCGMRPFLPGESPAVWSVHVSELPQ